MFLPHSQEDVSEALRLLGINSLQELFSHIEPSLLNPPCNLPEAKSEEELRNYFSELAGLNRKTISFVGGGAYDRIVPSAVWQILSRGEFLTAYTPYQAEASQGTLQALFEYQTLVASLTGMEVANASMYDGASAAAEAVLMAKSVKPKGKRLLVSAALHPLYLEVIRTYLQGYDDSVEKVSWSEEGTTDLNLLEEKLKEGDVYAVVVQYPNFLGYIEPLKEIQSLKERYDFFFIVVADPVALSLLEPPGSFGADAVVGESQQLGVPLNFGGPYAGFFTTRERFLRKMPGRLVGLAQDVEGKRAFSLVLQTREQHIRRERATSNICTNQNLIALANLIYLSLMGKEGLREVALQSLSKAIYLKKGLIEMGFEEPFSGKHLWEFPLRHEGIEDIYRKLNEKGFTFGIILDRWTRKLKDCTLLAITERRRKGEIDSLLEAVGEILR